MKENKLEIHQSFRTPEGEARRKALQEIVVCYLKLVGKER